MYQAEESWIPLPGRIKEHFLIFCRGLKRGVWCIRWVPAPIGKGYFQAPGKGDSVTPRREEYAGMAEGAGLLPRRAGMAQFFFFFFFFPVAQCIPIPPLCSPFLREGFPFRLKQPNKDALFVPWPLGICEMRGSPIDQLPGT